VANKKRRGRPPLTARPIRFRINLWLRPGEDDDLITYFSQIAIGRRPSVVKSALRAGGMQAGPLAGEAEDDDQDFAAGFLS
jgi:hypothetical protein